jgi:hypothetical protein
MPRSITTAMRNALAADVVRPVLLVRLEIPTGTVRATSAPMALTWDSQTWMGGARFLGLNSIDETTKPQAATVAVQFSGLDTAFVSQIMEDTYQNEPAYVWLACLDSALQVVADPILIFAGSMDEPTIEVGETAVVTVGLENVWADWSRPRVRRYNDADQQAAFPGDKGLQFVEQTEYMEISWGTYKGPPAPPPGFIEKGVRGFGNAVNQIGDQIADLFGW